MGEAKLHSFIRNFLSSYRRTSSTASFILVNGFVIAAVTYFILYFASIDIKQQEARSMTRDLFSATEQAVVDVEKTVRGLGYFYSSLEQGESAAPVNYSVQRLLADDDRFVAILWTTDKGVWQHQDLVRKTQHGVYSARSGWPSFDELQSATQGQELNQVSYITKMPWGAFRGANAKPVVSFVGLTTRMRLPDGGTGVLLAVTTPERLFSVEIAAQRSDMQRLTIMDAQTNEIFVDNNPSRRLDGAFADLEAEYPLTAGNRFLQVRYSLMPTAAVKIMAWSPWIALMMISLLTLGAAFSVDRKHVQDIKIAEMSKTLAGAHTELQSSISERDKLFNSLRKSERENRAVLNSVSDIIFETDESGKLVFLNETWTRVSGKEVGETLGETLFSLIDPVERAKQREMFEELVRGERQAYRAETRLDVGGNNLKPVEIAFSMLRMAEDRSLRVVGTITDIEKRRRAELAVREAEQRFRAMFENSISGIYQSSLDGKYLSVNPAMAEILGYASADDLIDSVKDIATDIYVRPEESAIFSQKVLFEGRVSGTEIEVKRKDGKHIWIMENARVVRNERGGIQCFEGNIVDITERKQAEEAMRQARLQAEMSSRSRMEFLANMSHELRTPLNAVIGFSEIIKDEVMGPHSVAVYKEYAQDIYDSGNYLLKVISEILEVSKIETGNRELNISTFRLTRAIKSCMTIMSSRVEEAGVTVTVDIPDTLPELMAEELGFKQIMLNLIGNAIKFTKEGGSVKVSASIGMDKEMIIDITDTGIGMTPEEISKAMQPFAKVDNNFSTMKAGTGLGLSIVDSLVRLHGGEFKLMSEKGVGTTARVIMPAHRVYHLTDNGAPQLSVVS